MSEQTIRGPWPRSGIDSHLDSSVIPLRLSYTSLDGWPSVLSLWFVRKDENIWCATSPHAFVVKSLKQTATCSFEVSADTPPYSGVRGRGKATLHPEYGGDVLDTLVDRYVGNRDSNFARWLLSHRDSEMAIRISPKSFTSWDFRGRMVG